MTYTNIANLLDPLQSAIVMRSWEDAEDIATEIARLCRLKRLSELQAIQEAIRDRKPVTVALEGSQRAKQAAVGIPGTGFTESQAVTLETRFDELGHAEPWRNEVACELNWLVGLAKSRQEPCVIDHVAHAAVSIAARVAQFEEIKQVKP